MAVSKKVDTVGTVKAVKVFDTIHIFGYGETQLIGKESNKKVSTSVLKSAIKVVEYVYSKKPIDNNATIEYHAVNIFNEMFVDFIPKLKGQKAFRVPYADIDSKIIEELVQELIAIPKTEAIKTDIVPPIDKGVTN